MRAKQTETRLSIRRRRFFRRGFGLRDVFWRARRMSPVRRNALGIATLVIVAELIANFHYFLPEVSYALGDSGKLLTPVNQQMASRLSFDTSTQVYSFNNKQADTSDENSGVIPNQQAQMTAHTDPKKGISVSDPVSGANFTMKPTFGLTSGRRDGNRLVYPLTDSKKGWTVYTMHAVGVKEDIILTESPGKVASFGYDLNLADGQEARLEADGSVGVYGNSLFGGKVTTGSDADAKLLEKARKNAPKDTRLFSIPAPEVIEADGESSVEASFKLSKGGTQLTVTADGLDRAQYPLSIDPSIYVVTAQQFMQGNNETNIDFNVSDKLIQKGKTTGARFDSWNASAVNLPAPSWSGAATATGGYLYQLGGTTFNGQTFTSQGANNYTVPAGVTSLTFKAWGGGGGSGAGGSGTAVGGGGGGGGYVTSTISVTSGETLTIYIGGGGGGGAHSAGGGTNLAGGGAGGGGLTSVYRGSTPLLIAAGGAGGGGARDTTSGGAGGAGGATTGIAGTSIATNNGSGGGGGTASAGGSGGNNPNSAGNSGSTGSSLTGGAGADGRSAEGADGSGAAGGGAAGGNGGSPNVSITRAGGGGGGAGYFGGGGGAATTSTASAGGGGGGGGSSFTASGSTSVTNSAGSGTAPGNASDTGRNGAGTGGTAGPATNNGNKGSGGALLVTNGAGGSTTSSALAWSHLNTDNGGVEGADPGNGVCSGWCSTSAYNLPSARKDLSIVAYNGFLYAIGGLDGSGNRTSTVYVAKLGANGEPRRWHPTDTNETNWDYWQASTTLSSSRSLSNVVAYNNRLYLIAGLTGTGAGAPVTTTEYADVTPTGMLGSWTAGTALPVATYGHTALSYNDRIYVIGGSSSIGGATLSVSRYIKLAADGSMTGGWQTGTSLPAARMSGGGQMGAIWGAYIYISGGCLTNNASGYCTSIASDTQVASINANGSIGTWNTVGTVSSQRTGASLITWRNRVYHIGGCSSQNATTGDCNSAILGTVSQGDINQDGDASTVGQSSASGTGSCNAGTSSTNCDIPSTIGNMLNAAVVTNGYLYIMGGCTNNTCSTTSSNYAYTAISSTGVTSQPAACPSGTYTNNIWCAVSSATDRLPGGVAASSPLVFNGRIYLIGGLDGTANVDNIDRASANADGSLSAWTRQTMTGADTGTGNQLEAQSYLFAYARANPASAGTSPGNLFIFGGCSASSSAGCTNYSPDVHKCNIALSNGAVSGCSATGQLQIGTIPGASSDGLGLMSGTVYANYIYLVGGVGGNLTDLNSIRYAKIDNSNNVVTADGGSAWIQSAVTLQTGRRRAAGFGYNGYLYVVGGFEASGGVLADIEFIKINVSDGSLSTDGFKQSAVSINQRWGLSVPVSNSYAYVIGGCTVGASPGSCTSRTNVMQTFQIYNNDSGAPAGFTNSANIYGNNRLGASAAILNGNLYVAAGCTSTTDCTTAISTVTYAPLDVNGSVGTWTTSTSTATGNLPIGRAWGKLVAAAGSLYYLGGQTPAGVAQLDVYYQAPDPSTGALGTWIGATNDIPAQRTKFGVGVWNNRLYVVGGLDASANPTNTIYVSPVLNGGDITTAWSTSTAFNVPRYGAAVTTYANNLYLFGGNDGTNYLSDSQYVKINPTNGLVGSWNYSSSLPTALSEGDAFSANGYIYLVGGRSAATVCDPITLVAPVSANTTITSGNNPTGIGDWYETNQRFTNSRYGAAVAYSEGTAYVMGGACGSTLTYAAGLSRVQQTTLLSQPQIARYSIAIDTDTDVYPNYWLLNGIDNSVGARWQLRYRSMHDVDGVVNPNEDCGTSATMPAMTTWGADTNFGNVTLGSTGPYIPKESGGGNINCARYYYFNVSVDSSRAYGYPDDVTRGPTISDLTLQFTADPNKRLMHGRTFTGGLQQPIDTPYYSQ